MPSWDRGKMQNPSLSSLLWRLVKYATCQWRGNSGKRWFSRQKWVSHLQWLLLLSGRWVYVALTRQWWLAYATFSLASHSPAFWCNMAICHKGRHLWQMWIDYFSISSPLPTAWANTLGALIMWWITIAQFLPFIVGLQPLLITLTVILLFMV